jgi:hypothetical protein
MHPNASRGDRFDLLAQAGVPIDTILSTWSEPECCRGGVRVDHRLNVRVAVAAVLGAVHLVDRGMDAVVGFGEGDVAFDAAGLDAALVPL